jgi:hypothetical protein
MDTTGGEELGRFWAAALGLRFEPDAQDGNVVGDVEGKGVAICRVPEEKSVKHRVHIDVHTGSVDDLVRLGATVLLPREESGLPWTVLADPAGGEFCAFERDDVPDYRMFQLVVDSVNAAEIADWWADVFGAQVLSHDTAGWFSVTGIPDLPFERITFQQVPEPKAVKNRIHWDVYSTVEEMTAAGAVLLRARDEEIRWNVMADPEGNEFCVFDRVASSDEQGR